MPKLLTYEELKPQFGIPYTRTWLAHLEAIGKFPKHVQIGESRIGWVESEIAAWVAARIKARGEKNVSG
jgi:prophage regulatory protein